MKIGRTPALGSVALLGLTALAVLLQPFGIRPFGPSPIDVPYSSVRPGTVAVELTGDSGRNGVYFVPKGTPLVGFLDLAGIAREAAGNSLSASTTLEKAATVTTGQGENRLESRPMDAAKRVALGIPIDLNRSSLEELGLVPGIGKATAERILERRSLAGPFRDIDELMEVRGIKEKRLEKLRPYLCIGC